MPGYIARRLLLSVQTLVAGSLAIFLAIDAAPDVPCGPMLVTVDPSTPVPDRDPVACEQFDEDAPAAVRYGQWAYRVFVNEPLHLLSGPA